MNRVISFLMMFALICACGTATAQEQEDPQPTPDTTAELLHQIQWIRTAIEESPISPDVILNMTGHLFMHRQGERIKSSLNAIRNGSLSALGDAEKAIEQDNPGLAATHFAAALRLFAGYHEIAKELIEFLVNNNEKDLEELERKLKQFETEI